MMLEIIVYCLIADQGGSIENRPPEMAVTCYAITFLKLLM